MSKIYVAEWRTESGDSGVEGYWTTEPTEKQLSAYFEEMMPDEFEDGYSYVDWELVELDLIPVLD